MNQRKVIFTLLTVLSIIGYGVFVFAAGPITYSPGETLNPGPGCLPDGNCYIDLSMGGVSIGSPVVSGIPNQILYTDVNGNVTSDAMFTRDVVLKTTTVGEDFGGGMIGGLQVSDDINGLGIKGSIIMYADNNQSISSFVGDLTAVGQRPWSAGFTYTNSGANKLVLNVIDDMKVVQRYADVLAQVNAQFQLDSTGNSLTWDADTNNTIIDQIIQSQNVGGIPIKGVGTSHADTATGENAYMLNADLSGLGGPMFQSIIGYTSNTARDLVTQATFDSSAGNLMYTDSTVGEDSRVRVQQGDASLIYSATGATEWMAMLGGGFFKIGDNTNGNDYLFIDASNGFYGIGDLGTALHGTRVAINDTDQAITFDFGGDFYSFPTGDGSNGQVMQTDGNGQLSWVTPSGGGSPAGSDTYVQYNNSGSFGASSKMTFDSSNTRFRVLSTDGMGNRMGELGTRNLYLYPATNSGDYSIQAPTDIAAHLSWILPSNNGSSGDVLSTDGAGQLSWATPSGGSSQWTTSAPDIYFTGGKVGIGTASPQTNLDLGAADGVKFLLYGSGGSRGYLSGMGVNLGQTPNSMGFFIGKNANFSIDVANVDEFFPYTSGYTSKFTMLNNGDVGIGTVTPNHKLDVAGDINFTGDLYQNGVLYDGGDNCGSNFCFTNDGNGNVVLSGLSGGGSPTGVNNFIAGTGSGAHMTNGSLNIFLGEGTGNANTSGNSNIFMGSGAGRLNTIGYANEYIGYNAGAHQIDAHQQIAIGYEALLGDSFDYLQNIGDQNTAIGYQAGTKNTSGSANVFLGHNSGLSNTEGTGNMFSGFNTGYSNTTGNYNIFLGYAAADGNISGGNNTVIGGFADTETDSTLNAIALGYNSIAGSHEFSLPDDVINTRWRGIHYEFPNSQATAADYVLVNNGSGVMSWVDGATIVSDSRLKSNITDLGQDILSKLGNVRTVTYILNSDEAHKVRIGFVAQNLEETFPELVTTRDDGYKAVYYAQMTPVLVQAVRELNLKITNIENFAAAENQTFLQNLIAWLGDTVNGLTKVHVDRELCIGATCINEQELQSFKNWQSGVSHGFGYGYGQ